jgi:hypothetical protein
MLADEITKDLRRIRSTALAEARRSGRSVALPLNSKGIHYGSIIARPDGTVDTSWVQGVNPDLRIRPFAAEGGTISIREFVVGAFNAEMSMESPDPVLCAATDPVRPVRTESPAGMVFDPSLDKFERPPVCSPTEDGDRDGKVNEIDPALIDHMEFYLLNYFKPATGRMTQNVEQGIRLMHQIGCTECHVQNLTLNRDRRVADVETRHDPIRGIFNRLFATATPLFNSVSDDRRDRQGQDDRDNRDNQPFPQLLPQQNSFVVENIFSDLKRHDLGPDFHEREYDGDLVREFVTEPLWGVGSTSPYGHDGRSINLEEVILRHGGEADAARDAFAALSDHNRQKVLDFLGTLVLFPPDDTASNLNPGNPRTNNPQDPAEHGSINLGALFQIPDPKGE